MKFGSVCSGIEAATVALHGLGWRAAWLAEIDKFASAVLAHHYPSVPNLGDMTKIARAILTGEVSAPDVLCGGTPCQAFSVAGLRESLADARGNLTLKFVEIANAIDHVRAGRGEDECIVFWENVPGVLSTKDNAFGCFLAGLAGEDEPLVPPGQTPKPGQPWKWSNAGAVYGPRRAVAWRTLDAQYFGVAQRRRRVFVVASARKGFDPAQVLFEWDGLRRDTAPSREAGKVAPTIPSRSTAGGGLGTDFDCDGGLIAGTLQAGGKAAGSATQQDAESGLLLPVAFGGNRTSGSIDITPALLAQPGSGWKGDFESETFLVQPTAHTLRGTPLVPVCHADTMPTMTAGGPAASSHNQTSGQMRDQYIVPVAFPANLSGTQHASTGNLAPALGAANPTAVAIGADCFNGSLTGDIAATMGTRGSSETASGPTLLHAMQVRRLTPTECERLQGFPDGYTDIPWTEYQRIQRAAAKAGSSFEAELKKRGKVLRGPEMPECPDGPRYKALGNSWAVPNVTWIGRRIHDALRKA